MAVKYLKNPDTKEKFYPITKSDCIIDLFSINNLEIDRLFQDSLSVSKNQNGMSYLNLQGLIHYHSKIKDYINKIKDALTDIPEVQIYTAGENITIENNVISAVIPEIDLSGYATEAYVDQEIANIDIPSLDGYATEEFVTSQGYLTEIPEGIATEQWVKDTISEVELTTSAALNDLNTRLLDTISDETIDALFL